MSVFETPAGPPSPWGSTGQTEVTPEAARSGFTSQTSGPAVSAGEAGPAGPGTPRVIGLDLSLSSTGLACDCGLHRIKSHPRFEITRFSRLRMIKLGVLHHVLGTPEICGRGERVDLVVVEDLALTRTTGQHLTRAGLWHLVMNWIDNESVPYAIVSPTSLKKYVTGRGNAGKDEVLANAIRRFPDAPIYGNDEADAYTLRAMGLDWLGCPPVKMPAAHRAALEKVAWPEATR